MGSLVFSWIFNRHPICDMSNARGIRCGVESVNCLAHQQIIARLGIALDGGINQGVEKALGGVLGERDNGEPIAEAITGASIAVSGVRHLGVMLDKLELLWVLHGINRRNTQRRLPMS